MEISRHWRLRQQRYNLTGEVCLNCNTKIYPPRDNCPNCSLPAREEFKFSGRGEVYSYTVLYNPDDAPSGFEESTPLAIALIRLDEGPLVAAQLTDLNIALPWQNKCPTNQRVFIGQKVEMVTRRLYEDQGHDSDRGKGLIVYGPKFRPILEPAPEGFTVETLIASLP